MIYDVNSPLFRSFLGQKGGSSDKSMEGTSRSMVSNPVVEPPDMGKVTGKMEPIAGDSGVGSLAQVTAGGSAKGLGGYRPGGSNWFRLKPITVESRPPMFKDNAPAIIFSAEEIDEAAKQFEFALILKFTAGRPSLHEIRCHICTKWILEVQPVISLLDPRHILVITENVRDMITVQSQDSRRIRSSFFRVFKWHKDYDFSEDSSGTGKLKSRNLRNTGRRQMKTNRL